MHQFQLFAVQLNQQQSLSPLPTVIQLPGPGFYGGSSFYAVCVTGEGLKTESVAPTSEVISISTSVQVPCIRGLGSWLQVWIDDPNIWANFSLNSKSPTWIQPLLATHTSRKGPARRGSIPFNPTHESSGTAFHDRSTGIDSGHPQIDANNIPRTGEVWKTSSTNPLMADCNLT